MGEINPVNNDTDLTKCKIRKLSQDVVFKGADYIMYDIPEHIHSTGNRCGENSRYVCRAEDVIGKEIPDAADLIEFNGNCGVRFGIVVNEEFSVKTKWDETEMRSHYTVTILRNDAPLYTFSCHDADWGYAKARMLLTEIQEGWVDIFDYNWQEKLINRKIYFQNQPAIIDYVASDFRAYIIPDTKYIKKFAVPGWAQNDETGAETWNEEYANGLMVELFSKDIYPFREDKQ